MGFDRPIRAGANHRRSAMRHRSIASLLAVLALLALASVAVAGGWAQVTAKSVPTDPPAGGETTIELNMLQHGRTPVSWPRLTVVATDAASGAVVRVEATATGPEGSYVAKITFPSAGQWTLTYESADLVMEGSTPIRIAAPVAAAPGSTPVEAPATQASNVLPLVFAALAVVALLAIGGGLVLRGRGASAGPGVSARI
jgi:hypothetical protein